MDAESHSSLLEMMSGSAVCYDCAKRLHKANRMRKYMSWLLILTLHIIISFAAVATLLQIPTLAEKLKRPEASQAQYSLYLLVWETI